MKVYVIMHEIFMEGCSPEYYDEIFEICLTEEVAINHIKNIDIWNECYTLGVREYSEADLEDIFDSTITERTLCVDSHGRDRFYILEREVKES